MTISFFISMKTNALSMNRMPLKFSEVQRSVELIHTIDALKSEDLPVKKTTDDQLSNPKIPTRKNKGDIKKNGFGFTMTSEVINGRLAMVAMLGMMAQELVTHQRLF